jgi:hypothetical protein
MKKYKTHALTFTGRQEPLTLKKGKRLTIQYFNTLTQTGPMYFPRDKVHLLAEKRITIPEINEVGGFNLCPPAENLNIKKGNNLASENLYHHETINNRIT